MFEAFRGPPLIPPDGIDPTNILNEHGICQRCKEDTSATLNISVICYLCKNIFHVISCTSKPLTTPTFLKQFNEATGNKTAMSRPGMFCYVCEHCQKVYDNFSISAESKSSLEIKVDLLESSIQEIKAMLTTSTISTVNPTNSNCWSDTDGLNSIRTGLRSASKSASNSKLVIKGESCDTANLGLITQFIKKNKITLENSYKDKSGNQVLLPKDMDRDRLKLHISETAPNIKFRSPGKRLQTIAITNLPTSYESREQLLDDLLEQNSVLQLFTSVHCIGDHLTFYKTIPHKYDESQHQALVNVSAVLRDVLRKSNDRLVIGLTTCRIYDRVNARRCNNCQEFGHYAKYFSNSAHCAHCAEKHRSETCTSKSNLMCINCNRAKSTSSRNHAATDPRCPTYVQKKHELSSLN